MTAAEQTIKPDDLLEEGARARRLLATVEGTKGTIAGLGFVSDAILAHVLFALWDSGFYEYSLVNDRFRLDRAADDLDLDETVLKWLLNHLVGRGILCRSDGLLQLTAKGAALSNILVRGTANLYLGGYGSLLRNLGPLLRKEIPLDDPQLARSGRHTGVGSEQHTCGRLVPKIRKVLAQRGARRILDLGCGAGGFLIQLARLEPSIEDIGVDMSAAAIAEARKNARRFEVGGRLAFVQAEIGSAPMPLDPAQAAGVEAVTAMYLLHEFGRHGNRHIVEVLRGIKQSYPGTLLVFAECLPADADRMGTDPPSAFSQLDYLLIHPLSGQGLPLAISEWEGIIREAGLRLVDVQTIHWIAIYVAES